MMFQLHTAFATELIALTAGVALLTWLGQKEIKPLAAKIAGYFVVVAVMFSVLCTLFYGIRYWEDGFFRTPYGSSSMTGMGGSGMMQGKKCPMMEGKPETQPSTEEHEAHHPN